MFLFKHPTFNVMILGVHQIQLVFYTQIYPINSWVHGYQLSGSRPQHCWVSKHTEIHIGVETLRQESDLRIDDSAIVTFPSFGVQLRWMNVKEQGIHTACGGCSEIETYHIRVKLDHFPQGKWVFLSLKPPATVATVSLIYSTAPIQNTPTNSRNTKRKDPKHHLNPPGKGGEISAISPPKNRPGGSEGQNFTSWLIFQTTHRIHGTGIYTYTWMVDFYGKCS